MEAHHARSSKQAAKKEEDRAPQPKQIPLKLRRYGTEQVNAEKKFEDEPGPIHQLLKLRRYQTEQVLGEVI